MERKGNPRHHGALERVEGKTRDDPQTSTVLDSARGKKEGRTGGAHATCHCTLRSSN